MLKEGNAQGRRRLLRLPSPAIVIAMLALLVAMGGTAYGVKTARHYPEFNGVDIIDHSLTGVDIQNGSLGQVVFSRSARKALKGNLGPAGPQGPQGAQGPQGIQGVAGVSAFSTLTYKTGSASLPTTGRLGGVDAVCPSGMRVTGGGVGLESNADENIVSSYPSYDGSGNFTSYTAYVYNAGSVTRSFTVVAICVPASQATKAVNAKSLNAAAR